MLRNYRKKKGNDKSKDRGQGRRGTRRVSNRKNGTVKQGEDKEEVDIEWRGWEELRGKEK